MEEIQKLDFTKPFLCMVNGLTDSGKSTGLQYILSRITNQRIAIVDYHDEYGKLDHMPNLDRFVPNPKEKNNKEARMKFLKSTLRTIKKMGYDIIVLEEFNQYVKTRHDTPDILEDLKNNHAHEGWNNCKAFFVMRRPTQTDSDFDENAHYMLIWRVTGRRTLNLYRDEVNGLDKAVELLDDFEFVFVDRDNAFYTVSPVPENIQKDI